jgi:hypothetical protein
MEVSASKDDVGDGLVFPPAALFGFRRTVMAAVPTSTKLPSQH